MAKYRIIYKLHPGEVANWREKYPALLNEEIVVEDGNSYSLYEYFATCHIQIGVYSAALFEGLGFGLSTYIYQIKMSEHMNMLCEQNYAKYFRTSDELIECMEMGMDMDAKKVSSFWPLNALGNMLKGIECTI